MVGRGVLRFKKGVCSKRVSGSGVLEAFSSRAGFICTTVVQIGVAMGCGAVEIGGIGKGSSKPSFESGGLFRDDVAESAEGWKTEGLSYESVNQTRLGMPKERQKLTSTKAGRRNLWSKTPTFPTKHQLDN